MTVKRSVGGKQAIVSSDDDKSERESVEPEAIVDEIVTVLQTHTDNKVTASNSVRTMKRLLNLLSIGENDENKKANSNDHEKLEHTAHHPTSGCNEQKMVTIKPTNSMKDIYNAAYVGLSSVSSHFANDSSGNSILSPATPSAIGFRTFDGEYRQHWKVGAKIELQYHFDCLPGTVTKVYVGETSDTYDVKLDNGDVVLNVRSGKLRTLRKPSSTFHWSTMEVVVVSATVSAIATVILLIILLMIATLLDRGSRKF